jgi:hypothetical protein
LPTPSTGRPDDGSVTASHGLVTMSRKVDQDLDCR